MNEKFLNFCGELGLTFGSSVFLKNDLDTFVVSAGEEKEIENGLRKDHQPR